MATISKLVVSITANSKKLKSGLKSATSSIKSFAKSAAKSLAVVGAVVAGVLALAFTKLVGSINDTATAIDKLAKTSSKLGLTVAALQKLQFQAKLSGVSAEKLNMSLQRMVRRVSEAARGTGEAVKALKELGLDAEKLNALSPDKQFTKIAEAMKKIINPADKVRLAMKLFDSEGVDLVNTLNLNLEKTGKAFDRLGLAISESGKKAVEGYKDAQLKIGALWEGLLNHLTVAVAPAFTRLLEFISETIISMGGMKQVAAAIAPVIIGVVNSIIKAFAGLLDTIDNVIIGFKKIQLLKAKAASFLEVTNPLLIAKNLIKGETPEAFKEQVRLQSEISNVQARKRARGELTSKALEQTQKVEVSIKVSAEKGSLVEDVETKNAVKKIVIDAVQGFTSKQARTNSQ